MIDLKVNGTAIPLNRFVGSLLEAQILATVKALSDIPEKIEQITMTVSPGEE